MLANSNPTSWAISSDIMERTLTNIPNPNTNVTQPSSTSPTQTSPHGPIAILWDMKNCPVPSDVRPEDVAGNIRMALRVHPVIEGAVTLFSAYGDFNAFPRRVREGCQRTGVKLVDVPNGRKDASDKAILVEMFVFALDNAPPSYIMLISGDVDFAPALHILGQRGYTVILVIPSGVGVSSALSNAGRYVWDWPSVARGEGFVPMVGPRRGPFDFYVSENYGGNDEEAIVYRGLSQSYHNSRDFAIVSQSLSECNNPCYSAGMPALNDRNDSNLWVQPGNLNGLKAQLVKLLEFSGGCFPLARLPAEYQKIFCRPLCTSEYGQGKLVKLLKKMSDLISVEGKGQEKIVYLRAVKADHFAPSKKDKKGKGVQIENTDVNMACGSSDEFSEDERVVLEEQEQRRDVKLTTEDHNLLEFKYELEEILVSYSCGILLNCFEEIYEHRYKKALDCRKFGVNELEELFEKLRDVVVLHEDPLTKNKFLASALT